MSGRELVGLCHCGNLHPVNDPCPAPPPGGGTEAAPVRAVDLGAAPAGPLGTVAHWHGLYVQACEQGDRVRELAQLGQQRSQERIDSLEARVSRLREGRDQARRERDEARRALELERDEARRALELERDDARRTAESYRVAERHWREQADARVASAERERDEALAVIRRLRIAQRAYDMPAAIAACDAADALLARHARHRKGDRR